MKIATRILVLAMLLPALNWLYVHTSYKSYLFEEADQLLQVEKVANCDVVYTSASSNFSPDPWHESHKKISEFIGESNPELLIEAFNIPASHARIHTILLRRIPPSSSIRTVIATVNLRSFGADWQNSILETPLNKKNVMYADRPPLLNRFLVSLNFYDNKSDLERENIKLDLWAQTTLPLERVKSNVIDWCAEEKWGDWTNPKRQLADQFIKQYAFVLDESNATVHEFDAMIEICKERNWKLIMHILPENIEKADSLVGSDLTDLMVQNATWLERRFIGKGATVINNVDLLPSSCFTDKDFPTEHYNEVGRRSIASSFSNKLKTD